jgi:hypothetical protein
LTERALLWSLLATFVVVEFMSPATVGAQSPSDSLAQPMGPTSSEEGPTRAAQTATARVYLDDEGAPTAPRLMPRYRAFQREFVSDFGTPRITDRIDPLLGFKARLQERWGDTSLYQWLERGLAFYTWVQASTSGETKGFDFKVRTGDMAGGKLGVRMSRPLGSGAVE